MTKIIIASKNPVKIQVVKNGFGQMFPDREFEFVGVSVSSNVSNQPFTNAETFTGAKNRVDNASMEIVGADFYVGIEGGIDYIENEMESFAWVVTKSADKYGKSRTGTLFCQKKW